VSVAEPGPEVGTAVSEEPVEEAACSHPPAGTAAGADGTAAGDLILEGVSRRIGPNAIISDVSFEVDHGELVVLVGPSGCGKSTLLRVIAGLDPAATGRITLAGVDITVLPVERRRIGLVFQDDALLPHRRIHQNIAFGIRHLPRSVRARRVAELLDLVRLPGMGDRYPHELSGGERQRAALARALAPEPTVVLLDEPFANLDPSLRDEVRHDVIAALRQRDTTAVLVTHERDEALAFGDRVAVMGNGRLHQLDRPEAVYDRPANRFVAGFVGEASFLPCEAVGVARGPSCAQGCAVVARPHDLSVRPGGEALVTNRWYLGSAWRYEVRGSDGTIMRVDSAAAPPLEVGDLCTVTVTADRPLHHLG
jgi:ABC-type Fe3+/spermidine/putrescine transport system ATPase subunit